MVKIDIKRSGFPVNIGNVELWFDSSIENLKNFVNVEEVARERIKEIASKAKHIHFPEVINEETLEEVEEDTINDAFSISQEYIAVQYDVIFGDGSFKKIYEEYPDVFALEDAFESIAVGITERLEEENKIREQKYKETKISLLDKKKQKQK